MAILHVPTFNSNLTYSINLLTAWKNAFTDKKKNKEYTTCISYLIVLPSPTVSQQPNTLSRVHTERSMLFRLVAPTDIYYTVEIISLPALVPNANSQYCVLNAVNTPFFLHREIIIYLDSLLHSASATVNTLLVFCCTRVHGYTGH